MGIACDKIYLTTWPRRRIAGIATVVDRNLNRREGRPFHFDDAAERETLVSTETHWSVAGAETDDVSPAKPDQFGAFS
jgi:hypothetical protein